MDFISFWNLKSLTTNAGDTCYLYAPGKSADAMCAHPKLDGDASTFAFECAQGTNRIEILARLLFPQNPTLVEGILHQCPIGNGRTCTSHVGQSLCRFDSRHLCCDVRQKTCTTQLIVLSSHEHHVWGWVSY